MSIMEEFKQASKWYVTTKALKGGSIGFLTGMVLTAGLVSIAATDDINPAGVMAGFLLFSAAMTAATTAIGGSIGAISGASKKTKIQEKVMNALAEKQQNSSPPEFTMTA